MNIKQLLNSGGIYINGRSKNLRPIIIINVEKILESKPFFGQNENDLIFTIIFIMEYVEKFMMVKGRIENLLLIIDCNNIGVLNAPFLLYRKVMAVITDYY